MINIFSSLRSSTGARSALRAPCAPRSAPSLRALRAPRHRRSALRAPCHRRSAHSALRAIVAPRAPRSARSARRALLTSHPHESSLTQRRDSNNLPRLLSSWAPGLLLASTKDHVSLVVDVGGSANFVRRRGTRPHSTSACQLPREPAGSRAHGPTMDVWFMPHTTQRLSHTLI